MSVAEDGEGAGRERRHGEGVHAYETKCERASHFSVGVLCDGDILRVGELQSRKTVTVTKTEIQG